MLFDNDASLEFLTGYVQFERANMIRRTSQLNTLVSHTGSSLIFPKNTMLHMIDNISHSSSSTDAFDPERYQFLIAKNTLKYLNNFVDFAAVSKNDLAKFSHRIYRSKLYETLKAYGMAHRKIMIPAPKLDTVIDNKNCIIIENYNPLYRIITTNNRPISQYFRYRAILNAVLNNTKQYDRQHFLVLPVPDLFTIKRSNVMGIIQSGTISSPRLLSNSHFYFFIIDLIALLLNNQSTLSTLNDLDRKHLSALNLMLVNKGKSIVVNIGKLAMLAKTKTYVFAFINNISRISGVDVPIEVLPDAEEDPGIEEETHDDHEDAVARAQPLVGTLHHNLTPANVLPAPAVAIVNTVGNVILPDPRITTHTVVDPKVQEAENKKEAHEVDHQELLEAKGIVHPAKDLPKIEHDLPEPPKNLSEKQKERIAKLENVHKTIIVSTPSGPQTIQQILENKVDLKIAPASLKFEHAEGVEEDMLESASKALDRDYQDKLLRKDIINSVVTFKENGLYLTGYDEKNEYNSFTRVKRIRAAFTDANGKKHTLNYRVPMPDDEGNFLADGVKYVMLKQLVNVPICKISPTRVSLISNYNKTLVEKVQSTRYSLPEYIAANATKFGLKFTPKHSTYIGLHLPYDYKQLGSTFSKISTDEYVFYFEHGNRLGFGTEHHPFTVNTKSAIPVWPELEKKFGVVVGQKKDTSQYVFMNMNNICTEVNILGDNVVDSGKHLTDYFQDFVMPMEWCNLKILDKNLPVVFIIAYRYGFSAMLRHLKIKYRFVANRSAPRDFNLSKTEMIIRFADGSLIFDRYPLEHSYLLCGWTFFPTLKRIHMIDLDGKDVYFQLLQEKGMSINYLRGIDNYFSFFVDPITKEILKEMHEPTTTRELLLRAVDMLVNSVDKVPSAIENFRVRTSEKISATIYNEIARQYANYVNSNFKDTSFSINTEAIYQRIILDEGMSKQEELNPTHVVKENSRVTYGGSGGRSAQAFVARDRKYPKDAIGVLGETTPDGKSVGMTATLTGNPKIKNLRGMFDYDDKNLTTTNVLSDTTILMPGLTHDDPKRANFCNIQLSHHVPTPNMKPCRMRTGFEMVIPQKTSEMFVGKARFDGKISLIDPKLNIVTVSYKNKTTDVFEYGNVIGYSPSIRVNHKIDIIPGLKVGSTVKKGDAITYHSEFFQFDPIMKQLSWNHGIPANVAIMAKDITLEDSCMLSSELVNKMKFDTIEIRTIQVGIDMMVIDFADVGTKVAFNDSLIRLKYEDTVDVIGEVDELFDDLKQVEERSKHDGEVVDIKVYYVAETLNPSLTKFVNKITYSARRRANATKGTLKEDKYTPVTRVRSGARIGGVQIDDSDIVVVFSIKEKVACGIGDKVCFDSALKSVVGRVEDRPMITEEGKVVDAVFGANSVFNRIILSPMLQGTMDMVLEAAEEDVLKMWFE